MKKYILYIIVLIIGTAAWGQEVKPEWHSILSGEPETFRVQLLSSTENSITVNVQVPGFYTRGVATPRGEAQVVSVSHSVSTAKAGEPDVPMTGIPAIIGDRARMGIRVVDAKYMDFENIEVAPSKGEFPRSVNPDSVPYTYGECYNRDAFYPVDNAELYEPYIMRDVRGQNMAVHPFAYNPAAKTLRVYYNMTVEMYKLDDNGINVKERRKKSGVQSAEFGSIYRRHFINYESCMAKYQPVEEDGDLLIICHDEFLDAMSEFVAWKRTRGLNTTIVGTGTTGNTSEAIKEYIAEQYQANDKLTHVLLVGDVGQIPGYSYSTGGSSHSVYSGKGDNPYGQTEGDDIYNDIFIGRFSAYTARQAYIQAAKAILYERDLTTSDTWCQAGLGVSSTSGNSQGHNSEDDYEHIENIRTKLLDYGYNTVYQDYYQVDGYPASTCATISEHINSGVGIINYCNHGTETAWQSHSPNYTNTQVKRLTNDNMLPLIFSTACLNGKYDCRGDCFAETWMRATNSATEAPTGAVGTLMSYISQPWIPPMWAQDEFVDIITESHPDNIKMTWGGSAINAVISIFDHYSTDDASAIGTCQAWILYGDPTLTIRTKTPEAMTVSHTGSLTPLDTAYTVSVIGGEGAQATVTDAEHNIVCRTVVADGKAVLRIPEGRLRESFESNKAFTLCLYGQNKQTFIDSIPVVLPATDRFAWQDEENIYVCGEGELRVFDLGGRQLSSTTVDGLLCTDRRRLGISRTGVYLFNLNNESLKMIVK